MIKADMAPILTPFGEVELVNASQLRVFRKNINQEEAKAAWLMHQQDLRNGLFTLEPIPEGIYERAIYLARKHTAKLGARSLDILHVATALILAADTFYTFDGNQRKLAQAEGLNTA